MKGACELHECFNGKVDKVYQEMSVSVLRLWNGVAVGCDAFWFSNGLCLIDRELGGFSTYAN